MCVQPGSPVNLAHGFIAGHPVRLLDQPTAPLDAQRRDVVIAMIRGARGHGVALVGIFHDTAVLHGPPYQEAA